MYVKSRPKRGRWDCDSCGHPPEHHEHYHAGDHCQCGCPAYQRTIVHILLDLVS